MKKNLSFFNRNLKKVKKKLFLIVDSKKKLSFETGN